MNLGILALLLEFVFSNPAYAGQSFSMVLMSNPLTVTNTVGTNGYYVNNSINISYGVQNNYDAVNSYRSNPVVLTEETALHVSGCVNNGIGDRDYDNYRSPRNIVLRTGLTYTEALLTGDQYIGYVSIGNSVRARTRRYARPPPYRPPKLYLPSSTYLRRLSYFRLLNPEIDLLLRGGGSGSALSRSALKVVTKHASSLALNDTSSILITFLRGDDSLMQSRKAALKNWLGGKKGVALVTARASTNKAIVSFDNYLLAQRRLKRVLNYVKNRYPAIIFIGIIVGDIEKYQLGSVSYSNVDFPQDLRALGSGGPYDSVNQSVHVKLVDPVESVFDNSWEREEFGKLGSYVSGVRYRAVKHDDKWILTFDTKGSATLIIDKLGRAVLYDGGERGTGDTKIIIAALKHLSCKITELTIMISHLHKDHTGIIDELRQLRNTGELFKKFVRVVLPAASKKNRKMSGRYYWISSKLRRYGLTTQTTTNGVACSSKDGKKPPKWLLERTFAPTSRSENASLIFVADGKVKSIVLTGDSPSYEINRFLSSKVYKDMVMPYIDNGKEVVVQMPHHGDPSKGLKLLVNRTGAKKLIIDQLGNNSNKRNQAKKNKRANSYLKEKGASGIRVREVGPLLLIVKRPIKRTTVQLVA